jgi:hypothetical protein
VSRVIGNKTDPNAMNACSRLTYNGYEFSGPLFSMDIVAETIDAEDGRVELGVAYTINVRAFITDDPEMEAANVYSSDEDNEDDDERFKIDRQAAVDNLADMRARLNKRGGKLDIFGCGIDITINDPNDPDSFLDLDWGPNPGQLKWKAVGGLTVFEVQWSITFKVSECYYDAEAGRMLGMRLSQVGQFPGGLVGLSYAMRYDIDCRTGLSTRIITGEIRVGNKVQPGTTRPITTVDQYRDLIQPIVPQNFRRVRSDWDIHPNKTQVRFTITDDEMGSGFAYPPGVIEMSLQHSADMHPLGDSEMANGFKIVCTLSGSISVLKTVSLGAAWNRVVPFLQGRVDRAIAAGGRVMFHSASLTESIFPSPSVDFALTYIIIADNGAATFGNLIGKSGLFTSVEGYTTWDAWRQSMVEAWSNRGLSKLEFTAEQDAIVNNCVVNYTDLSDVQRIVPIAEGGGSLQTKCPDKARSYLKYQNTLRVKVKKSKIPFVKYPNSAPYVPPETSWISEDGVPVIPPTDSAGPQAEMGTQTAAPDRVVVHLYGTATRLGYWPEAPYLAGTNVGDATMIGDPVYEPRDIGDILGCKAYRLSWSMSWIMSPETAKQFLRNVRQSTVITQDDPNALKVGG